MLSYKSFCEAKDVEEIEGEGKPKADPKTEPKKDEADELDSFQSELLGDLSKKYPDEEEEDIKDMVLSVTKKIYAKFEPKKDGEKDEDKDKKEEE